MLEAWDNKQRQWTDCVSCIILRLLLYSILFLTEKRNDDVKRVGPITWMKPGQQAPVHTLFYIFFYIYCPVATSFRRRRKREKILMWDNPHVSHPSNLCRCCCHRSSNNSNSSSEKMSLTRRQEETPFERKCRRSRLPTDIHIHMEEFSSFSSSI